jgi:glycosyltransferase involved in cell wall biosynthesis
MEVVARTERRMRILLLGNYVFDGSMSMQIWANALHRELVNRGIDAELILPKPVLGRIKPSAVGLGKWLGYIDRFLLFPRQLKAAAAEADVVHICDHGSAMFAAGLKDKPVIVTCHDMLAVRGALGEIQEMRSSIFGRLLQLWIRQGLQRATRVACVSQFTLDDVRRILNGDGNLCKVQNGLNYPFHRLDSDEADRRLTSLSKVQGPFVLHVGSNHPRKNRDGVLRVFAKAAQQANLQLVIAGEALNEELLKIARELQVEDRIVQVARPRVEIIEALYNRAVALLFPSRYEGFGWPPIEAQACGCPVVATNIPPLIESLGQSAELFSPDDEDGMAKAVVRLATDTQFRETVRQRGLENVQSRFQTSRMMDDYLSLYGKLLGQA